VSCNYNPFVLAPEPYGHYLLFKDGSVYSTKTQKWLKGCKHRQGYWQYCLTSKGHKVKNLYKHQVVVLAHGIDIPDGMHVDHIDGNVQNNTIYNLRVVTPSINKRNCNQSRSKKGYSYNKQTNKWRVSLGENNKVLHFGYYPTEQQAQQVARSAIAHFESHGTYAGFC
jgi:hypothetical protein